MNEAWIRCLDMLGRLKRGLPFGGYPLHLNEDLRPFFIIGSGRSGTTLLRRILTSRPDCHIPPETYVLPVVIREYRTHARANWQTLVRLVSARFEYHPEFAKMKACLQIIVPDLVDIPKEQRSLAFIIDRIYLSLAEQAGSPCRIWGDKTPNNTYHLDRIRLLFPKARFIHMIRDACDVAVSMVTMGRYETLAESAERWRTTVKLSLDFMRRYPDQVIQVRYEDLVSKPTDETRRICEFLGL
nr:sulfotransferase [Acidobacteriota bacterium]